jgi:poly(hydroxyalkanoate) depolymerase family esterase
MRSLPISIRRSWLALAAGIALIAGTGCEKMPDKPQLLAKTTTVQPVPVGWNRLDNTFPNHPTWTFMPAGAMPNGKHALMVVLHGCNQTFDQLKQFGNLENAATKRGLMLAIPDVGKRHFGNDIQRCWNYDQAQDNDHHMDEIIHMTETLAAAGSGNDIDRNHIYIVGLSSGGALALDIACKRPDLYAGVGSVAGPSMGSMQGLATNGPFDLPPIKLPPGLPPIPMLKNNVDNAADTCKALAAGTGNANQLETQVANIAVGDMDKGSPSHNDRFPFQPPIDQAECDHAGQVALIPYKWDQDNVDAFRRIYGTGDLGAAAAVQGGLATMRVAAKNGKARVAFVTINNVGHAWPAGKGSGTCTPRDNPNEQGAGIWIAQQGLDYPEFITGWLLANNARSGNAGAGSARQKSPRPQAGP